MSDNNLDINDIQDKDGDWLTGILEPYAEDIYDEIMLLNITKKDLSNKKDDNIQQVGYKAPYGDDDEIEGLIYYYFKKCVEWYYYRSGESAGISLSEAPTKETKLIIEGEKDFLDNTSLVLLYCEGTYVWSLGG
mgnify:FL=1